jgi:hypothetical protein
VVLVPLEEWRRLQKAARPTLKELLLADIPIARRGRAPRPHARSPGLRRCICSTPTSRPSCAVPGRTPAWSPGWRACAIRISISRRTLREVQAGVEQTREQDPAKAAAIEAWIEQVEQTWNVLPMVHNLIVVTGSWRDFAPLRVPTLDPFAPRRGRR